MNMHKAWHARDDIDYMYQEMVKEDSQEFKDSVKASIRRLENYIKKIFKNDYRDRKQEVSSGPQSFDNRFSLLSVWSGFSTSSVDMLSVFNCLIWYLFYVLGSG